MERHLRMLEKLGLRSTDLLLKTEMQARFPGCKVEAGQGREEHTVNGSFGISACQWRLSKLMKIFQRVQLCIVCLSLLYGSLAAFIISSAKQL